MLSRNMLPVKMRGAPKMLSFMIQSKNFTPFKAPRGLPVIPKINFSSKVVSKNIFPRWACDRMIMSKSCVLQGRKSASTTSVISNISSFSAILSLSSLRGWVFSSVRRFSWRLQNKRKDWRSNFEPLFEGNNLIYAIIGSNIGVFLAWESCKYDRYWLRFMANNFMVSPNGVLKDFKVHTLVTAMFSHKDGWHLFANMMTFYFFGENVMRYLGPTRLGVLYLGGGLVSSACHVLWPYCIPRDFPARYRTSKYTYALGASGAVAAVVTWSILKNPRQSILIFFVLPVPAGLLGAAYLLNELLGLYRGSGTTGNAGHLGGAAFGALFFVAKK